MGTRLVLVRHGRPAAFFTEDTDPGLDATGRAQAEAVAGALAPLPVVVSPLRRTRETAAALEARWGVRARVEPAVGEIPSPPGELASRGPWLRDVLGARWPALPGELRAWRDGVLEALRAIPDDSVVVTHFVVINVAVGAAEGDDRVTVFRPGYCSRTVIALEDAGLRVVERGAEADTVVA